MYVCRKFRKSYTTGGDNVPSRAMHYLNSVRHKTLFPVVGQGSPKTHKTEAIGVALGCFPETEVPIAKETTHCRGIHCTVVLHRAPEE